MLFSFAPHHFYQNSDFYYSNARINSFFANLYMLLISILILVVNCVFVWKIIKPDGEFVVATVFVGLALLWALLSMFAFLKGNHRLKEKLLFIFPFIMILEFIAWFFLLANIIVYPAYHNDCKKNCEGIVVCCRHYHSKYAWAVVFAAWTFIHYFIFQFAAFHYMLREYYGRLYTKRNPAQMSPLEEAHSNLSVHSLPPPPPPVPPTMGPLGGSVVSGGGFPMNGAAAVMRPHPYGPGGYGAHFGAAAGPRLVVSNAADNDSVIIS